MSEPSFQITVNDNPITAITTLPENQDPTCHLTSTTFSVNMAGYAGLWRAINFV